MSLLDAYERKARLTPGLLAVAPVAFMIVTLGFKKFPAVAVAVAVLSATGGGYALSVLVAHLGRRAQVHLWDSWDGPPTIRFLRTRYEAANPVQREVWRRAIEMTTGVALLTPDAEAADPTLADNTIRTAVDQMRRLGQDPAFPLVAAENTQYGFERNLYGFRWVGRVISATCTAVLVLIGLLASQSASQAFSFQAIIAGAFIDCLFFVGWIAIPSVKRTKGAADRYAEQFLQAVVAVSRLPGRPGAGANPPTGAAPS
jgi:hypothetical protein